MYSNGLSSFFWNIDILHIFWQFDNKVKTTFLHRSLNDDDMIKSGKVKLKSGWIVKGQDKSWFSICGYEYIYSRNTDDRYCPSHIGIEVSSFVYWEACQVAAKNYVICSNYNNAFVRSHGKSDLVLILWLANWLIGWLADWLIGWLADWLIGWLANCLIAKLSIPVSIWTLAHCKNNQKHRDWCTMIIWKDLVPDTEDTSTGINKDDLSCHVATKGLHVSHILLDLCKCCNRNNGSKKLRWTRIAYFVDSNPEFLHHWLVLLAACMLAIFRYIGHRRERSLPTFSLLSNTR